ncbi:TPA: MFS transporter, partial [Candidatus Poribacteria bacterium]|nr:MFS transporter [Candidatus Poribacteria bacterium]
MGSAEKIEHSNRLIILIAINLSSFLAPFMASSVNIALPSIGKEFDMGAILLGWVATSYILSSAIFLVPFGRLGDIYGRKLIFSYGIIVYTLASLLIGFSFSSEMLIFLRVLQGIGASMLFSTAVAILTSVFPANERGKVLGINVAVVYVGLSLGPTLGGLLTQYLGWRSIFFVNVPLGFLIIIFTFWKLKGEWTGAKGEKFDFIGSIIYGLMLISIMYGFTRLTNYIGVVLVAFGVLCFCIFLIIELRIKNPVLNISLFKNSRSFAFSNLAALINYSATSATGFLISLYLQYIKSLTPRNAGFILLAQPITQAIFSPLAGRLSDKIEPRIVASIGMGLTAIGLLLLINLNNSVSLLFIIVSLIFLGFGFALFSSPNTNAIMSSVEKRYYGVASGTLATMRMVGQMLSMGVVMLIFSIYIGKEKITPEYYQAFLISA